MFVKENTFVVVRDPQEWIVPFSWIRSDEKPFDLITRGYIQLTPYEAGFAKKEVRGE